MEAIQSGLRKSIGNDKILDSDSVFLKEHESYKTEVLTSDNTKFRITVCVENTPNGEPSVHSIKTEEPFHIKIILDNLPDGPGSTPEPMEIASNEVSKAKLLFSLTSEGVQDGKRQVSYKILESLPQ